MKKTQTLYDNTKTKINGHFSYTLKDFDGNIIKEYKEDNKIMDNVLHIFQDLVLKRQDYSNTSYNIDSPVLTTIGIGSGGLDSEGQPKILTGQELTLGHSEYQATWTPGDIQPATNHPHPMTIIKEGYRGDWNRDPIPSSHPAYPEYGARAWSDVEGSSVTFTFQLMKFTGNLIDINEAGLFMQHEKDLDADDKLGVMFSMKTFPTIPKTDQCILEIVWRVDFGLIS